ncbi:MAG: tyrosine--tRNA ligase [Candidatus Omnitrophota bacterium]|nr:tyrosine--tRNA ligase [Candidatus Omnitrophota bacterium]
MPESVKKQIEILREGLVDFISEEEFASRLEIALKEKRPLRIKYGADPSAPDLHLGHTVPLRKLREFQDFGHQIVFIIGDFTARIGDPTQRSETRKMLTRVEVNRNAMTYQSQVFRILDHKKTEVRYNSEWLSRLKPEDFLNLTSQYTVARLLERDDFQKRYKEGKPIAVVEFLYPLLQGHDSVVVKADLEIGGTDQKFNLLVGRELQRSAGELPQMVMTLPLIEGTDGVQKMSKSYGNAIALEDSPREIFGKIMSIPDAMLERYWQYLSALDTKEIKRITDDYRAGKIHPRILKADLGERVVSLYHGAEAAAEARKEFNQIFKDKGLPDDIPTVKVRKDELDLVSLLKEAGLVASKGEARRLIDQGGVKVNQEKITDQTYLVALREPVLIQCGKRKFARIESYGG